MIVSRIAFVKVEFVTHRGTKFTKKRGCTRIVIVTIKQVIHIGTVDLKKSGVDFVSDFEFGEELLSP